MILSNAVIATANTFEIYRNLLGNLTVQNRNFSYNNEATDHIRNNNLIKKKSVRKTDLKTDLRLINLNFHVILIIQNSPLLLGGNSI